MNFPEGEWIRVRVGDGGAKARCKILHVNGTDPFWSEVFVRFERRFQNLNIHDNGKVRILYRSALEAVMVG